jgi:hypothetical protein
VLAIVMQDSHFQELLHHPLHTRSCTTDMKILKFAYSNIHSSYFLATLLVVLRDQRAIKFSCKLLHELTFTGSTNGASFSQFPWRFLSMHIYLRFASKWLVEIRQSQTIVLRQAHRGPSRMPGCWWGM